MSEIGIVLITWSCALVTLMKMWEGVLMGLMWFMDVRGI